ncbi:YtpI family protein [Jeotgalicoccus psychrophilus]|uniref:YtpI family protein n=1 Tax=Jeotgalicoccus psychrophilus TaxID=157228 RepID=UPI000400DB05|nr:YtpI family protein [Jeotgalicoccus psychrophilus]
MEFLFTFAVSFLVTAIVATFILFVVFKVRKIRTIRDVRSAYYNSIARIWLGLFLVVFGLNTMLQFHTLVAYIIGGIFVLLGGYQVFYFNKARKYFKGNLPIEEQAWKEFEAMKENKAKRKKQK